MNKDSLLNMIDKLKEFNNKYGIKYREELQNNPSVDSNLIRYELMKEENEEFLNALYNNDIVEVADAVGDMLYILLGTVLDLGLQDKIIDIFYEIHNSNLSKLGEDGNPIYREDGKLLKGPNFFPPNLVKVLGIHK